MEYMRTQALTHDETKETEFHTYTPSTQKSHGFVLCGLDRKPSTEEIQDALLREHEIETTAVYEMKATHRHRYLVITSSAITLKYLTQTVRYLISVKVSFVMRDNKKRIIQCHWCQVWGHACEMDKIQEHEH